MHVITIHTEKYDAGDEITAHCTGQYFDFWHCIDHCVSLRVCVCVCVCVCVRVVCVCLLRLVSLYVLFVYMCSHTVTGVCAYCYICDVIMP